MIYVYLGNEINILKMRINELISSLDIKNIIEYDYSNTSINEILEEVCYIDLFNEKKLIIVSSFTFKKMKDKEKESLKKYIDNMNENVIIFKCIDEKLDSKDSLVKKLKEKCKVVEIVKMDYKATHEFITKILKDNGFNVSYDVVKKILSLCENNADYALKEIEKLMLYKIDDKNITIKDVEDTISKSNEKEMFTLIDAVMSKNIGNCFTSYKILKDNTDATVIIDAISKQFRYLYQIKVLMKSMPLPSIVTKISINPYVGKKLYESTRNFSEEEILDILYKLSDMDISIKVKGNDKNKVLEIFFLNL